MGNWMRKTGLIYQSGFLHTSHPIRYNRYSWTHSTSITPIQGWQDTFGRSLDTCQHYTVSCIHSARAGSRKQDKAAQAFSSQAEQIWSVLCRGYAHMEFLTERKKKFSLFCSSATAVKHLLLPCCCLEGSGKCPLFMDTLIHKEPGAPQRDPPQTHPSWITWYAGDLMNLLSTRQPSVWYMCSWYSDPSWVRLMCLC